ncbi:hypothetical protein BU16DRAFT_51268 [Lophium mytilinum]|uniref:Uncharacterized protein n=1 Tax=Lophium mytilinum TaxID=390894 RepID=A0A6A6QR07_9PEZI|nr:hypothetical protein BU16DRAFT_51268 [Lophium mytilinum]
MFSFLRRSCSARHLVHSLTYSAVRRGRRYFLIAAAWAILRLLVPPCRIPGLVGNLDAHIPSPRERLERPAAGLGEQRWTDE